MGTWEAPVPAKGGGGPQLLPPASQALPGLPPVAHCSAVSVLVFQPTRPCGLWDRPGHPSRPTAQAASAAGAPALGSGVAASPTPCPCPAPQCPSLLPACSRQAWDAAATGGQVLKPRPHASSSGSLPAPLSGRSFPPPWTGGGEGGSEGGRSRCSRTAVRRHTSPCRRVQPRGSLLPSVGHLWRVLCPRSAGTWNRLQAAAATSPRGCDRASMPVTAALPSPDLASESLCS